MTPAEPSPESVLIVGAGIMGHGIAVCFLDAGWQVTLVDPSQAARDRAETEIASVFELLQTIENPTGSEPAHTQPVHVQPDRALQRLALRATIPDVLPRLVLESVPEDLDLKQEVLRELEGRAPAEALICTNTSALEITSLATCLARPERFVGTHFWNPPYILPCVEVVPGRDTSQTAMNEVVDVLRQIGRRPVALGHDLPGFVGNRLQHALQREAMAIVESGVVQPEDLDDIVIHSIGLRMALMGPFERADLGGIDTTLRVHEYLLPLLARTNTPSPLLADRAEAGNLGAKTGKGFYTWDEERTRDRIQRRDEKLLQILRLLEPPSREGTDSSQSQV